MATPSHSETPAASEASGPTNLKLHYARTSLLVARPRRPQNHRPPTPTSRVSLTIAVKAALLDQSIVAGVGNIYADEALFVAKVSPLRKCTKLRSEEWNTSHAIHQVLKQSIATGGSTLRDYVNAKGERGRNQETHAVYGRSNKPCLMCNAPLHRATIAQRTTVWCTNCQC